MQQNKTFSQSFSKDEIKALLGYENKNIKSEESENTLWIVAVEWLTLQQSQIKYSTLIKYSNILKTYIFPYYADRAVGSIKRNEIRYYSRELLNSGGHKGGLSPSTVNAILSVLKSIFYFASNEMNIQVENISKITVKASQKVLRILTIEEQNRITEYLLENLTSMNLGILIALYTGIRLGELCALQWEDISLKDKSIFIHKTMQRIQCTDAGQKKTQVLITPPKSFSSIRNIPIPKELFFLISTHQKEPSHFLLSGSDKYVEPRTMEYHLKKTIQRCKIPDIHFHVLRHTFATRCIELGFDIKGLSEILGHANVNITLNRYVHPSMRLKQKNMDMLSFPTKSDSSPLS